MKLSFLWIVYVWRVAKPVNKKTCSCGPGLLQQDLNKDLTKEERKLTCCAITVGDGHAPYSKVARTRAKRRKM